MTTTKAQSNFTITTERERPDGTILFKVKDAGEFIFDPAKASDGNRLRAMRHGFVQRISDAAARSKDTATGVGAPPAVKLAAMRVLADHYMSGAEGWSPEREGGGPGLDGVALAAVAEATGKTVEQVRLMVAEGSAKKSMTQRDYLAALGTAEKVKPILERMRAAAVGVSGDDLLAEATGEGEVE